MGLSRSGRPRVKAGGHVRGELLDRHGRCRRRGNRVEGLREDFPRQNRHSVLVGGREAPQGLHVANGRPSSLSDGGRNPSRTNIQVGAKVPDVGEGGNSCAAQGGPAS
eukprot:8493358-Alexandrium_andersonii.AAC.1